LKADFNHKEEENGFSYTETSGLGSEVLPKPKGGSRAIFP
jgi:hypothetical protein